MAVGREPVRVLIVSENASLRFGGEAANPWLFFKYLRARGVEAWLLAHDRCRDELLAGFPSEHDRLFFTSRTSMQDRLVRWGTKLPDRVNGMTLIVARGALAQRDQRRTAQRLVRELGINVVHQPTPISPKMPSDIHSLGAPVVIGPLCGGMEEPADLQTGEAGSRLVATIARRFSFVSHWLQPGKRRAAAVVVSNDRTRAALPRGVRGAVHLLPESGVDLNIWRPRSDADRANDGLVRFVYLGRLVGWKGVDLLLEGFAELAKTHSQARLEIVGTGGLRESLAARAATLGVAQRVEFAGFVTREEGARRLRRADVFCLTSLRECGGNALLEAMAAGLPSIVIHWGGPGEFIDDTCGMRILPAPRSDFITRLAEAMRTLCNDASLRQRMGEAAIQRIRSAGYSWDHKVDRMLAIYEEARRAWRG